MTDSEVTFSLLSSLMKLAGKEMTTMHAAIKDFMLKLEASPDYFIHKIAEGTSFPNKSTSPTPSTARHLRVPTKSNSTTKLPSLGSTPTTALPVPPKSFWYQRPTRFRPDEMTRTRSINAMKTLSAATNRNPSYMQQCLRVQAGKSMGTVRHQPKLSSNRK